MRQYKEDELFENMTPVATLPTVPMMGFDLVQATRSQAVEALLAPGRRKVAFMNAHCANVARHNEDYACTLMRADHILPDGIGVELATRMGGSKLADNLNGTDLTPDLMKAAADQGKSVFLLGGTPETVIAAAASLQAKLPHLHIAGTCDGYDGLNKAVSAINASGADILLVAMGVPLQDIWIDQHFDALNVDLALGVGALFDFWAGNVARAPKIIRSAHMEWAWRLALEPRRLAKRYLIGNFSFMAHAALWSLRSLSHVTVMKRLVDVTLSFGALFILSPLLLLTALAIRAESKGAPIFKQTRVGKDGRPFTLYKFRSMYRDSEARRAALLASSDRDGVCFKSRQDPRVTRMGAFLRRYSIDELPQIFNVLRGDMSIVGPRPGLPEEVERYSLMAKGRLAVKPGLTGIWQVSGRADIGFDQMIAMDLAYVESKSLMLDAMLIGLTLRTVISGRGAY